MCQRGKRGGMCLGMSCSDLVCSSFINRCPATVHIKYCGKINLNVDMLSPLTLCGRSQLLCLCSLWHLSPLKTLTLNWMPPPNIPWNWFSNITLGLGITDSKTDVVLCICCTSDLNVFQCVMRIVMYYECILFFFFFLSVFPVQGNFISLHDNPCAKIPHLQSAEQCGGHQPWARKCVYQRGLGAGDTGMCT